MAIEMQITRCHVCKTGDVNILQQFSSLGRVASDCRPWGSGGALGVCNYCGITQKPITPHWQKEADLVYSGYELYHQSTESVEQSVFDQSTGNALPRSKKILEFATKIHPFHKPGRMLDVGCGNGAMLYAFSNYHPQWTLYGFEPNLKEPEKLSQILPVDSIYQGELFNIPGNFECITLIHVLEHVVDPVSLLKKIVTKLNNDGVLLIQVPYFLDNPFDLLIVDHCTHFTVPTLSAVLSASGFEIVSVKTDVVDKEISLIAKKTKDLLSLEIKKSEFSNQALQQVDACISWIHAVRDDASSIASTGNFGLFGTSISANWLLGELGNHVKFFVEEDKSRVGRPYRGQPVYHPLDMPLKNHVYLSLPYILAQKIAKRLIAQKPALGEYFFLPPTFDLNL